MDDLIPRFNQYGRVWFRGALSKEDIDTLSRQFNYTSAPGQRHVALNAQIARKFSAFAQTVSLRNPVGLSTLFHKSADTSWRLPWHQDRTVAMPERLSDPGYERWSRKAGVWYCEPPLDRLQNLAFVHVLLDDVTLQDGPMQIALGSHKFGRVGRGAIGEIINTSELEPCIGQAGDIIFLKFLILHRSLPNRSGLPRRTLRVDFGGYIAQEQF